MMSGIRSDEPPSNGLAVARAREADDGVVALAGAPALDRYEARLLVPQLVDHLVDLRFVDGSISGAKGKSV